MRSLLLSSCLLLLISGCTSPYRDLRKSAGNPMAVLKYKPVFVSELYKATIDVVGKQLSGLLLIKTMPDSNIRLIFSNETGLKFFDFEFKPDGRFKVYSIINKLNRRAVVNTLRKDFELMIMNNLDSAKAFMLQDEQFEYSVFPPGNEFRYYITDKNTSQLSHAEGSSKNKPRVKVTMQEYQHGVPGKIDFAHETFNFEIHLKRLER